jgi:hypothetical protein
MQLLETTIFVILNVVFAVVLSIFIFRAAYNAQVYEQSYAKEIALLIDAAKPNTDITLGMADAISTYKKYHKQVPSNILDEVVKLDNLNHLVRINLADKNGYYYKYFSDYDIKFVSRGSVLQIEVGDKDD